MKTSNYTYSPRHHDDQVLSPPLTPALSPFKRDLNYRRASANDHHPYWINNHTMQQQQQQQQQRAMSFTEGTSSTSRKCPIKQNKHACNYPQCGWSFKRYEHLKRHMLVHTGDRPHACPFPGCGKRFSRTDNFHAHYRTHTKKTLQKNNEDSTHLPSLPPASSLPTPQDSCMNNSKNSDIESPMHPMSMPVPSPPRPHPSPSYRSNATSDSPQIHHQYQPNYHYNHYNNQPTSHYYHQQQQQQQSYSPHTLPMQPRSPSFDDDKQHICTYHQCQRRFKRLEHLKRHMRIHTLERPFQCHFPGCQKSFSRSDNLTQHSKTHRPNHPSPPAASDSSSPNAHLDPFHPPPPPPPLLPPPTHSEGLVMNDFILPSPYKHRPSASQSMHHWPQQHPSESTGGIHC